MPLPADGVTIQDLGTPMAKGIPPIAAVELVLPLLSTGRLIPVLARPKTECVKKPSESINISQQTYIALLS